MGIGVEIGWNSTWKDSPGFGDTPPQLLIERWVKDIVSITPIPTGQAALGQNALGLDNKLAIN
jgi:hypothetical protein